MKPIIFARVANMKYYKGITDDDMPENGGSYVKENNDAHECNNFTTLFFDDDKEYCLGFTQLLGGKNPQLHIEKIFGCEAFKTAEYVDDVIVVFCSKARNSNSMRVVGFYKHATVFRECSPCDIIINDYEEYTQWYNFKALKDNCVLLPVQERSNNSGKWFVPTSGKMGYSFGYGHSNIWYAGSQTKNKSEIEYVEKMINSIETYEGDNII